MIGDEAQLLTGEQIENLKITAEVDKQISVEKYRLVNIYFRNLNDNWLRVKNVEVLELSNKSHFNVILGNDLNTWLNSLELDHKLKKEDAKKENKTVPSLREYDVKDHLYNRFAIPAQLQTNKWVLVQITKSPIQWFKLKLSFIDGTKQIYKVNVK